jgi:hypothetical protein
MIGSFTEFRLSGLPVFEIYFCASKFLPAHLNLWLFNRGVFIIKI